MTESCGGANIVRFSYPLPTGNMPALSGFTEEAGTETILPVVKRMGRCFQQAKLWRRDSRRKLQRL